MLCGLCLIAAFYGLWGIAVFSIAGRMDSVMEFSTIPTNRIFLFLATFIGMAFGAVFAARLLHNRSPMTLLGRPAWVLRDFAISCITVIAVFAVGILIWSFWFDAKANLEFRYWLWLAPFGLLGLLIQTGTEELVFRGYIQQQLAARFTSPIAWMILPSLLFGLAHYDPVTLGDNWWIVIAATALFGMAAADLTAKTGSLGAAWGFHFVNNIVAIMILATDGPLTGLALNVTPYGADAPILKYLMIADMASVILAWGILRRILQR